MPISRILTKEKIKHCFEELFRRTWSTKINSSKISFFLQRKKLFKIFDTKIFALSQRNILIYSKIEFLQKQLLRIIKALSTVKISSSETFKGYSSHPHKHFPAKCLRKLSVKINFFRERFYLFIGFFIPKGLLDSIGDSKEIILR